MKTEKQTPPETKEALRAETIENTDAAGEAKSLIKEEPTERKKRGFFVTIGGWLRRTFTGASKDMGAQSERLESPNRMILKSFFSKKLAVGALVLLVGIFLFVFIGPVVSPIDLNYAETTHKNLSPGYSFMKTPRAIEKGVKEISSYSTYTLALSKAGKTYAWGKGKQLVSGVNLTEIPKEVKSAKIAHVAAGMDHAIAIGEDGKVYAWGVYDNGQYGTSGSMIGNVTVQPEELINGRLDIENVKYVRCGQQVTAILMQDGTCYAWGNDGIGATNMTSFKKHTDIEELEFTQSTLVGIDKNGKFICGNTTSYDLYDNGNGALVNTQAYIGERRVVDIAATLTNVLLVLEDGEVMVVGSASERFFASLGLLEGEKIVAAWGGARHYILKSDQGRFYGLGEGAVGQLDFSARDVKDAESVFVCAFQNYAADKEGRLVGKWGLKGYLMGTDDLGRDVLGRVMNGGKTTMTIGAVAVIVSSIIAVIVGCVSGYFGGWVDLLLMRITEIFSSIPFLPFALILSAVLTGTSVTENTRIFIIMLILGVLSWTSLARMIRGQVLVEREKEFVTAAKAMGVKERKIAFKHILPNIVSVIIVSMTLDFAGCMLTEASLSYLGFGVQLPRPTWGNMLNGCNNSLVIQNYWWRWAFPALFLMAATICINVIGDALRDVMDPKSTLEN
ncbi:MAG: ABC transporter permease subunit [Clostridia bacterium]|nr:ABC transporter permease subunit [Clostridia bacterium]